MYERERRLQTDLSWPADFIPRGLDGLEGLLMSGATGQISEVDRGHAPKGTVNIHFRPEAVLQAARVRATELPLGGSPSDGRATAIAPDRPPNSLPARLHWVGTLSWKRSPTMQWPTTSELGALIQLPEGYRFEFLRRANVHALAAALGCWHPDIAIGGASCYLREAFYADHVYFEGGPDRDVMVVVFVQGQDLVGMWSLEKETDSLTLYARLIVIDPKHRSARLASNVMPIAESVGRAMGAGLIFGAATLKIPHMQHALEAVGWQFVGFSSGYDQEMVSPGVVKRVFEAVYCKVLVPEDDLVQPDPKNLTPRARALWEAICRDTAPAVGHRP